MNSNFICIFFIGDILKKSFLTTNLIAHRGIHYNYLENTLGAFKEAIKKNYIIELDVRLTKDKKVIVFHDNNLFRITGINKSITESTYEELKEIINIPTLKEVLNLVSGKVPIIIEIKLSKNFFQLEKKLSILLDNYYYRFAIQSFNPLSILWFRINRPSYIRGYLINSICSKNIIINRFFNSKILDKILKPNYLGVNLQYLKNNKIKKLRCKYLIIGYTINDKEEYTEYKQYADNFICNIGKEPYK